MAQPQSQYQRSTPGWRKEPCTEGQVRRLLFFLQKSGQLVVRWRGGLADYQRDDACDWVRSNLGVVVNRLEDLTKGQVQSCFEILEGD